MNAFGGFRNKHNDYQYHQYGMKNKEKGISKCVLCNNNISEYIYIPCGHICACFKCWTKSKNKCLFCGKKAQKCIKCAFV